MSHPPPRNYAGSGLHQQNQVSGCTAVTGWERQAGAANGVAVWKFTGRMDGNHTASLVGQTPYWLNNMIK